MTIKLVVSGTPAITLRNNLAGLQDRFNIALRAATNMAASLIKERSDIDIASAGRFGMRWIDSLHVTVEQQTLNRMRISVTSDIDYAGIFEEGGTIAGSPLLWLPISGTDAEGIRARDYGGLFSGPKSRSGRPLLFSTDDKQPKYFGIEAVTIPKLFHINQIVRSVMANFRAMFDAEWRHGK